MMDGAKLAAGAAAILLLVACEARIGKSDRADDGNAIASAETKSDEGSVSIDVPGFNMKIDVPEGWAEDATVDSDSDIIPPGARMKGVHVQAGRAGGEDGVELRFTASDAPAKVAEWYRDDARTDKLTIASVDERDGVFTVTGTDKDDGDAFTVQLSGAEAGGTDGRLTIRDAN